MAIKVPPNKSGIPYGAYILTGANLPARVVGTSNKNTTEAEVWGPEQEQGSVYTNKVTIPGFEDPGCMVINKRIFLERCKALGYENPVPKNARLRQWDEEQKDE